MQLCFVEGCSNEALFTLKNGKKCCANTYNRCPTSRSNSKQRRIETNKLSPSPATLKGFKQPTKNCPKCSNDISIGNFDKHIKVCGVAKSVCIVCETPLYNYNRTCSKKCANINRSRVRYDNMDRAGIKSLNKFCYVKNSEILSLDSSYELHVCVILDAWVVQGKILDWEKNTTFFINYINNDGKMRRYYPDFKISQKDYCWYVETKGYQNSNDLLKEKAAKQNSLKIETWLKSDISYHMMGVLDSINGL